ncbi:HNH endonuclease [Corynebacterium glaucum]|uniref:HNH endonuclease signature motif containing protein n=1 Tax=Corynebacterium glaucum TaxID=187491 RepID=UPI0025B5C820|nr:HNH endonuclease signature motif containing protein [Corynebacterium glaucum]WJZ07066.1 HNH endonuclease [Corynebacterium glaucum]
MNNFHDFLHAISAAALDTLVGFDRQAALDAGVDPSRAKAWAELHDVYFGTTNSPQKQRLAGEKARRHGFSLDQLALLERRLRPIKHARTRMKLRLALLDAKCTYKKLSELANKLIPKTPPEPPRKQVSFTRSRQGYRTMRVTADERDLADLEHALRADLDSTKPIAQQMLERFLELMRGDGTGVPKAVPRPLLLIPLPEWIKVLRDEGDDTVLGLSDGTTITGAEYLNRHHATVENGLEAALFHPEEGPVNLYRDQRFANQKQRDLARATLTMCPVPDCRQSADSCEINHIRAWKHGGETNLNNLAPLCRYHNRVNDDDPERARRGRIEYVSGTPVWHSPRGYRATNTHHPYGAMQTLFG